MGQRWAIDLTTDASNSITSPPGFQSDYIPEQPSTRSAARNQNQAKSALKEKKAWEVAKSPIGTIFMTMFMMWMSGSSVNIFSMSITIYAVINAVKAILNVNAGFKRLEDPARSLLPQKLLYIFFQLVTMGIAVYKANNLGLLPTVADWSLSLPVKEVSEFSSVYIHS